jgi:phosphoribosylformylglycinamidine synthase
VLGETFAELGGSEFADVVLGIVAGRPPALDLDRERALLGLLRECSLLDLLSSAHDCSDGGIAIALVECAIAGGHGFAVDLGSDLPDHVALFSESASRVVVSVAPEREDAFEDLASRHQVPCRRIGETGGPRAVFEGILETTVERSRDVSEGAIPRLMGERV